MLNDSRASVSTTQLTSLNILNPLATPVNTNGLIFLGNVTTEQRNAYQIDFLKLGALIYNLTTNTLQIFSLVNNVPTWTDVANAGIINNAPELKITPNGAPAIPFTGYMLSFPIIAGDDALFTSLKAPNSVVSLDNPANNNTLLGRIFYYKNTQTPKNSALCMITTQTAPDGQAGDLNTLRIAPIPII